MTIVEQVLVVERSVFDAAGSFQGLCLDPGPYLERFFSPGAHRFIPRPLAEADPSFKQLIPYVVMIHADRVLSYVRGSRAGEKRLVGQRSIGIGGHINPTDEMPLFSPDFRDVYRAAVEREISEEVVVSSPHRERIVGLLNDDSTEVGRVHLGVVHLWELEAPDVRKREQMITQLSFMSLCELREISDTLESWSRWCLEHLDELLKVKDRGSAPASY